MLIIEVRDGELLGEIEQPVKEQGITDAAIVTLIGAVDSFTLSTMPAADATKDILTAYDLPAEMTATGEIVEGDGPYPGTCTGAGRHVVRPGVPADRSGFLAGLSAIADLSGAAQTAQRDQLGQRQQRLAVT